MNPLEMERIPKEGRRKMLELRSQVLSRSSFLNNARLSPNYMLYQVIQIEKIPFDTSGTHSEQKNWVSEPLSIVDRSSVSSGMKQSTEI